ncbi:sensor histidine kinase [Antarctobacter heliothermus]|uniref:histidine kinase n=1 Tax=Antarctobacter heliothermus TaxID=74033 RepID=A0A239GE39_9RHOB|nr:sensor histidine kinase [Antarctobacter heliothermus]SNS67002.1 Histidine kinase-, DNA gyrase B-, and HSP90-like ATPase [Antarctobacter heliothermus]
MKNKPSDRELDSYLYAITHDLKSFSRAMRVIPDWIIEDIEQSHVSLPEEVTEHLSMLQHYARGMDKMLDGLTDLSRVGRLAHASEQIQLREALDLAWTEIGASPGFTADFSQVDATIMAPANDIQRLLQALLRNSVCHHDGNTGLVRAKARPDGDRIILDVMDDGPGIDPAYHDKVFDPLHTLLPKDDTGFSGLGLTVARKVMTTLGGEIAIVDGASANDRGCTIRCDLPTE